MPIRRSHSESGQALLEYALTAMLFFTLIFVIMDGGRILWNYVTLSNASRVGARYAITHGPGSSSPLSESNHAALDERVYGAATGLDQTRLTISPSWSPEWSTHNLVTVTLEYTVEPITSIVWPGQTFTLRAHSTMLMQN